MTQRVLPLLVASVTSTSAALIRVRGATPPQRRAAFSPAPLLLLPDDSDGQGGTVKQTGVVSEGSVAALRIYKSVISPLIPKACRFIPTCSEYGALAFERYPPLQATTLTAWRLLRCNPLHVKGCGCGCDDPVWPPVPYWAGDGRIRTFLDDELSRKRANGEPVDDESIAFGGADPLGLAKQQRDVDG